MWEAVAAKSQRLGVHSPTGAQRDMFDAHERDLGRLADQFPLEPGQSGLVVALGERICLDYVSRPDAFARLHPKLLTGAMLDALEWLDGSPVHEESLARFLDEIEAAARTRLDSVGLGTDVGLESKREMGSDLELDGELVQLSALSRG